MMGPERSTGIKSRKAATGIHTPTDHHPGIDGFCCVCGGPCLDEEWKPLDGQPPVAQPVGNWWPPTPAE